MKTLKIFSIVLGIHLLAVPLVILQISRSPVDVDEDVAGGSLPEADPVLPFEQAAVLQADTTKTHTVRQGENPSTIAATYGMTTAKLMELNGIEDARGLRVGQKLKVIKAPG